MLRVRCAISRSAHVAWTWECLPIRSLSACALRTPAPAPMSSRVCARHHQPLLVEPGRSEDAAADSPAGLSPAVPKSVRL